MSGEMQDPEELERQIREVQYEHPLLNLLARWRYYTHATNPVDYLEKIVGSINLSHDGTLLDVGCSFGQDLLTIRNDYEFGGTLIGMERAHKAFNVRGRLRKEGGFSVDGVDTVSWINGDAAHIPLADNSVDVLMARRMLYHVPDYEKALEEFQRVVKPGGDIVITTAGSDNKFKHRGFERDIANYLNIEPPTSFTARFDAEKANEVLPRFFTHTGRFRHRDSAVFNHEDYDDYLQSLDTMRGSFNPPPNHFDWEEAKLKFVIPAILKDIQETGEFTDTIDEQINLCENTGTGTSF